MSNTHTTTRTVKAGLFPLLLMVQMILFACTEQSPNNLTRNQAEKSFESKRPFNSINSRLLGSIEFSTTLHPILVENCAGCHGTAGIALPLLADQDSGIAQSEILDNQKVNLSNSANSRIVKKLQEEFHYCWSICQDDAQQLQAAIDEWATLSNSSGIVLPPAEIISSNSMTLADGVIGSGTPRYDANVIALFEFKEGTGNIAKDTSGVLPALDLTLEGTTWAAGQGIEIKSGIAVGTAKTSKKLYDNIVGGPAATQEYSIEAWVTPASVAQEGPARLVTYSDGTQLRNFTMGQENYNYVFRNRTDSPDISKNGTPALHTKNEEQVLQASQQHVVMTFSELEGRKIYVNGIIKRMEALPASTLSNWDPNHVFAIGNEVTNNRLFMGVVKLVAIHKVALTPEQVMQNFDAGVGIKYLLNFDLGQVVGQANNFIQFEVSELDNNAYLFNKPVFITDRPNDIQIKNIQISVNGQIPVAGQTWRNVNTTINRNKQSLHTLAAVIGKDAGPKMDQFSVVFEVLGSTASSTTTNLEPTSPLVNIIDTAPRVGLRTFEQITHTMAILTGVDANSHNVNNAYKDLKQQLPTLPTINGFLASHQVGIAKLALEYCDTLLDTQALRDDFFGVNTFSFDAPVSQAFANSNQTDQLINQLVNKMFGIDLINQPDNALVKQELSSLINDLSTGCNTPSACDATRTKSVIKASCAAVLGSAAIIIQ